MKLLMKTALSALALGSVIGMAHAEDAELAGKPQKPPTGCGELCTGSIPIELTVQKHCDLDVVTNKISLTDGGSGNGSFKVGANAPYNLLVSTTNGSKVKFGNNEIPIVVKTTRQGSSNVIPLGQVQSNQTVGLGSWAEYNVNVSSQQVGITKPAGVYTDNYNIKVYF